VRPASTRYVVLLRAINLGKTRRVAMPRLREILTDRGHGRVVTHLNSGNVLLDSPLTEAELAADVGRAIESEFGFAVPVVLRTGAELAAVVAADPFGATATDPSRYSVTFLSEQPAADLVAALPPAEDPGEYLVDGRELYLWLPDGIRDSPMALWKWDRLLGTAGTNRNWNTVRRLAELAAR
jgi:uncharacterized protein (DUF1697 family)